MSILSFLYTTLFVSLVLGAPKPIIHSDKGPPAKTKNPGATQELSELDKEAQIFREWAKQAAITKAPPGVLESWTGTNACVYKGIECDTTPNDIKAIAALNFNSFGLEGAHLDLSIINKLRFLTTFYASGCRFSGPIPQDLSQLPYFWRLDLSFNDLSGPFPPGILTADLATLDLRSNNFEGPLPADLFKQRIHNVSLNNNKFSGQLPSEIGSAPIWTLALQNNQFDGPIPKEITTWQAVDVAIFSNNSFSGPLPTDLGALKTIKTFDVQGNKLSGPIPGTIVDLPKIKVLNFAHNQFSGPLPTDMGKMKALASFIASDNNLSGVVPESLCALPNIGKIELQNNNFSGELGPACLKALSKQILDVSGNSIKNAPNQKSNHEIPPTPAV